MSETLLFLPSHPPLRGAPHVRFSLVRLTGITCFLCLYFLQHLSTLCTFVTYSTFRPKDVFTLFRYNAIIYLCGFLQTLSIEVLISVVR